MAARSKVRSGSRVALFVDVEGAGALEKMTLLGLVDNFDISHPHMTTVETGVGSLEPDEIVHHGTGAATVSWTRVETVPAETLHSLGIVPTEVRLSSHHPVDIYTYDLERAELTHRVIDALPTNFAVTIGAQTTIRDNVSMTAKTVRFAADLN